MALSELIIAARADEFDLIRPVLSSLPHHPTTSPPLLVEGGATRQQSVANAARAASGDFLLVHDAARPLVSPSLIARVCQAALTDGAAIAAIPCPDTVKVASRGDGKTVIERTLDRQALWLAQTPQVFRRDIFIEALAQAESEAFEGTDCASLVEHLRGADGRPLQPVTIVEGEACNFKVTYPADLERAASLITAITAAF